MSLPTLILFALREGPSLQALGLLEDVARAYESRLKIRKAFIEKASPNSEAYAYEVEVAPTIVILDEAGELSAKLEGFQPRPVIDRALMEVM